MKNNKKKHLFYAWTSLAIVLLATIFFATSIKKNARMETNLDKYMPSTHPAFVYSDMAEEWFNIKDGILIAIENPSGIYNATTLEKIKEISLALQDMTEFDENDVMSLYTADNIIGDEYGLNVKPFYSRIPTTPESLEEIRTAVRTNDMVYGRFVSEDETVALIVAGMHGDAFSQELYKQILDFARTFEDDADNVYVAGRPIVEGNMALLGPADMKRMVPIVVLVMGVVLYLLLRSVRATTATLLSVFVSTIWAFGAMAVTGVPIYAVSTMIPVMLIAIGVAYGVYFYNHLARFYQQTPHGTVSEAIKYTVKILVKPLSMAAFTTIIGFISLLSSQVYPIKYFGTFTAVGILVTFVLALTFLPSMVYIFGYKPRPRKMKDNVDRQSRAFRYFSNILLLKRWWVLGVVVLIIVFSAIGIQRVWINSSFLSNFEDDSEIVLTDKFVNSKFGGTSTLNVVLESKEYDAFKQPENLMLMDEMQAEVVLLPKVGNSFSLADYLKRMNKVMNEDKDEFYSIPSSNELIAQYLLLYEMSSDPQNLQKVINYDYNRTNLTFQLKGDDSKTIKEAMDAIATYKDRFEENGIEMNYAGSGYKALVFSDLILEGQILSILISLGLVFILLSIMFNSLLVGLVGSVPIVLTALISFGVMGLLDIPLSTTTALLSSIAIGIGVDYAIHFLQYYQLNLKDSKLKITAIYRTMNQTGKAILFNAMVVISGFLVLLFSVFPPNRRLGALVSMNMFTSLVGTLSVMMILLFSYNVFVKGKKKPKKARI